MALSLLCEDRHGKDAVLMTTAPFAYEAQRGRVRIWTCSVCGKRFEWSDEPGAEWFGSLRNLEEYRWDRISVVCSAECKRKAA
jgi:hypothetical protein